MSCENIWKLQDVLDVNKDCYWFEKLTWWRKTKTAPCLPDVIEIKNDDSMINEQDTYRLIWKIHALKYECDYEHEWIKRDPVQLRGKKPFGMGDIKGNVWCEYSARWKVSLYVWRTEVSRRVGLLLRNNGSFTQHGTGNGSETKMGMGTMFILYCSYCTEAGTGEWHIVFYLSFPVIHKVDNIGIFVQLLM